MKVLKFLGLAGLIYFETVTLIELGKADMKIQKLEEENTRLKVKSELNGNHVTDDPDISLAVDVIDGFRKYRKVKGKLNFLNSWN